MRTFVIVTISWLLSSAAFAQQASQGAQGGTSISDFSGIWARVSFPGFGRPLAGAGPVINKNRSLNGVPTFADARPLINKNRSPNGVPSVYGYVGDYTNPILKPHTAEIVKKHGEIELGGTHALNPRTECWPTGVPLILENTTMQIIQQPDKITILYSESHEPTSPPASDSVLERRFCWAL
jgi:hypothetical protein